MKLIKLPLFLLVFFLISIHIQAQDKIFKKNKEVILCKVIEVDGNYIKYSQPEYDEDATFSINKSKVSKIVYEDGSVMDFEEQKKRGNEAVDHYSTNSLKGKKNAIKMGFFAPMTGNLTFGYERSLGPQKSVEATLGIIGVGGSFNPANIFTGFNPNSQAHDWNNAVGFFVALGYKMMRDPQIYNYPHLLKGSYLRPEVSLTYFTADDKIYYDNPQPGQDIYYISTADHLVYTFTMNIGKQWVFQDVFLFDWHFGIGYGFGSGDQGGYYYSHIMGTQSFPIALSAGLKIGVLL